MAVVVVAVRVVRKSIMVSSAVKEREEKKKKGARQPANRVPYWGIHGSAYHTCILRVYGYFTAFSAL